MASSSGTIKIDCGALGDLVKLSDALYALAQAGFAIRVHHYNSQPSGYYVEGMDKLGEWSTPQRAIVAWYELSAESNTTTPAQRAFSKVKEPEV